jgi:hypothetical protein
VVVWLRPPPSIVLLARTAAHSYVLTPTYAPILFSSMLSPPIVLCNHNTAKPCPPLQESSVVLFLENKTVSVRRGFGHVTRDW